jgi:hypothetical protein
MLRSVWFRRTPLLPVAVYVAACLPALCLESGQGWVVFVTGIVLAWYTWETWGLRCAANAQTEQQIQPFVILERGERDRKFQLRNLGSGLALNLSIDDIVIDQDEQIVIRFGTVVLLPAGACADVAAESFQRGRHVGDFFTAHINPRYATMALDVCVRFHNIKMVRYVVATSVGPRTMIIKGVAQTP